MSVREVKNELIRLANPEKAAVLARFFKTGKDQYSEGDLFLGVMVPQQRATARKFRDLSLKDIAGLLSDKAHECRLTALLILVDKYGRAGEKDREEIFRFYLDSTNRINNWDLVDLSAPKIVGEYLLERDKSALYDLARSELLWERRIAIISTFAFIRKGRFADTLALAEILINDRHDLIHKAVGWMLREVGKKDRAAEEVFLRKHCRRMPRTMLRYATEKFDEAGRKRYAAK